MVDILEEETVVGEGRIRYRQPAAIDSASAEATVRDAYAFDAPIDQTAIFG